LPPLHIRTAGATGERSLLPCNPIAKITHAGQSIDAAIAWAKNELQGCVAEAAIRLSGEAAERRKR
jgi:hypothetical protein